MTCSVCGWAFNMNCQECCDSEEEEYEKQKKRDLEWLESLKQKQSRTALSDPRLRHRNNDD